MSYLMGTTGRGVITNAYGTGSDGTSPMTGGPAKSTGAGDAVAAGMVAIFGTVATVATAGAAAPGVAAAAGAAAGASVGAAGKAGFSSAASQQGATQFARNSLAAEQYYNRMSGQVSPGLLRVMTGNSKFSRAYDRHTQVHIATLAAGHPVTSSGGAPSPTRGKPPNVAPTSKGGGLGLLGGAGAGFMLGGPLGAGIGAVVGYMVQRKLAAKKGTP